MTPIQLLAEAAREGFSLYVEGEAVRVEGNGPLPPRLLRRLREAREEIRTLLEPLRDSPERDEDPTADAVSDALSIFADYSPAVQCRSRGDPWARAEAAATIAKFRRWRDRRRAIAARDAWHERIAIATIDGGLEQWQAERLAADELIRFSEAWIMTLFSPRVHWRGPETSTVVPKPPLTSRQGVSVPVPTRPHSS